MPEGPLNYGSTINDIEAARGAGNSMSCSQLGKTLISGAVTAIQWTACWSIALTTNVVMCAIPGAALGALGGYGHARWNEPCIKEINSVAVDKCALRSPDIGKGALYGASATALIGAAVSAVGFFKNPTREGAKETMKLSVIGAGYCCAAIASGLE